MPSKKKKYNARFPPARIKKIMQTNDEIGKVAAAVPVLISKCVEMFLVSILEHTGEVTKERKAKTMSTSHLKECINKENMFDFLKDVVATVPDMQSEDSDAPGSSSVPTPEEAGRKLTRKRSNHSSRTLKKRTKVAKTSSDLDSENQSNDCDSEDSTADVEQQSASVANDPVDLSSRSNRLPVPGDPTSFHIPLDQLLSGQNAKQAIPPPSSDPRLLNQPLVPPPPTHYTASVNTGFSLPFSSTSEQTDINENAKYKKVFNSSSPSHRERNLSMHSTDGAHDRVSNQVGGSTSMNDMSKPYKSSDPALAAVNYSSQDSEKLISQQPPMFTLSSLTQDTERLNTMYQLPSISRPFVTDEDDDYDA